LKILITNTRLDGFTGTEVVVRDLALELRRQGHMPLVYSPVPGAMAQAITSQGIEVATDLNKLSTVPDIIHGHHHAQVVEALLHFPSLPAVFVCHSGAADIDEPFYFPRILRYVAVDTRCKARLENTSGIPTQRIEVILNAVDLQRFQPRSALPPKPRRALVFSNYASRYTHLPAVRRACRRMGLELDVLGDLAGTCVADPESVLPGYDLVFAKARCALEAMACGTPVLSLPRGSAPEIVKDGVSGYVCKNIEEMSDRALEIRDRGTMPAAAIREFVDKNFSVDAMVSAYMDLYKQLLPRKAMRTAVASGGNLSEPESAVA